MKRILIAVLLVLSAMGVILAGCGKKQQPVAADANTKLPAPLPIDDNAASGGGA